MESPELEMPITVDVPTRIGRPLPKEIDEPLASIADGVIGVDEAGVLAPHVVLHESPGHDALHGRMCVRKMNAAMSLPRRSW